MNLSLKNRIAVSFVFANVVILVLAFLVFHFLESLGGEFENITEQSNEATMATDRVRISAISILKHQRRMLDPDADRREIQEQIMALCDAMKTQLDGLDNLYDNPEIKRPLTQMSSYVESLRLILSKATFAGGDGEQDFSSVGDLADRILETYSDFSEVQYIENQGRKVRYERVIKEIKKNMMITLIVGLLGTIVLGLIVPSKIALPFKKIKDALRELQECNFDVSIHYDQKDEIGEIATEMNKMIHSIKVFEELRANKISVENRKFDALANMVKSPVLVANAEGELIYMNSHLYSLLGCQSEQVLGRPMTETAIPKGVIHIYDLAIKRRSKIENEEVEIRKASEGNGEDGGGRGGGAGLQGVRHRDPHPREGELPGLLPHDHVQGGHRLLGRPRHAAWTDGSSATSRSSPT